MKPVSLEASMMKRIGELNKENALLKSEVERLKNNCDYIDEMLDRELDKTAMLSDEVQSLRKELAEAQENYHLVNEMVAKLIKEGKKS
jgi:uncharacterized small protein (DUF1192 family)